MIREWEGVDCATVMQVMLEAGIGIDVGLWAPVELGTLLASGLLPRVQRISIELAPLDGLESTCPRLTHGMSEWTWPLVADAFRRLADFGSTW